MKKFCSKIQDNLIKVMVSFDLSENVNIPLFSCLDTQTPHDSLCTCSLMTSNTPQTVGVIVLNTIHILSNRMVSVRMFKVLYGEALLTRTCMF